MSQFALHNLKPDFATSVSVEDHSVDSVIPEAGNDDLPLHQPVQRNLRSSGFYRFFVDMVALIILAMIGLGLGYVVAYYWADFLILAERHLPSKLVHGVTTAYSDFKILLGLK